jgi:hypothetical protein
VVNDPIPIAVNGRAQGYFANHGNLGRIGMHRKKRNAFGHGVVQANGKISKGADCWYFDITVGTSSFKNHLQNGALDDLDLMTLGLAMSLSFSQLRYIFKICQHFQF